MPGKINWDALGIGTSLACAIHCALLPLILTSLPVLGIEVIDNVAFEYTMIFIALGIGSFALLHGYRRHHHNSLPSSFSWAACSCFLPNSAGINTSSGSFPLQ
jgi:hypothetical protein